VRGVTFDRLYSAATTTGPSMQIIFRGKNLGDSVTKTLAAASITTTAIASWRDDTMLGAVVSDFAHVLQPDAQLGRWDARAVSDAVIAHVREPLDQRELLWVHYFDAHAPIDASRPEGAPRANVPPDLDPSFETYVYAIAAIDRELGRVLDALVASGELAHTVVIVTADHGESFGLHGVLFHGVGAYEGVAHVPAVLVAPGLAPGRYGALASHRDIAATIVGAFGEDTRATEELGRSWLRLRAAPSAPLHRFVVVHSARLARPVERLMPMAGIVEDNLKLVETFEDGLLEMYDPVADPLESNDLVPSGSPEVERDVARLRKDLALYRDIDEWP
jgi:arylsulfatase A-like enzyme